MADEKPPQYDLESDGPDGPPPLAQSAPTASASDAASPEGPAVKVGIPIEDAPETPASGHSVKDLDVCPNCGASMRGTDMLVCIRCGFDLKSMKVVSTVTGETTVEPEAAVDGLKPLVQPGLGDLWLPGALAAIAGLILLVGHLAGWHGLFPAAGVTSQVTPSGATEVVEATRFQIGIAARISGVLRCFAIIAMWTGCGVAALAFMAHLLGQRLGDLKLGAMRMLAIVAVMRLATLIDFPSRTVEWMVEALVEAAVFTGLVMVLFKLKPRDAPTLAGAAVAMFMLLWLAAWMIVWVTSQTTG